MESLQSYFVRHPGFQLRAGIFRQQESTLSTDFESTYLNLRRQEGRLYDDDQLTKLPHLTNHPLQKEWSIRRTSANNLVIGLQGRKINKLVEIGCGNGWLLRHLTTALKTEGAGIDINLQELEQAVRVFGSLEYLVFAHADILSGVLNEPIADVIVLASVIQYFPDLNLLLSQLMKLLAPSGEIHILDSPLYTIDKVELAKMRSDHYFMESGSPSMKDSYFHHTWKSIQDYHYQVLYDPDTLSNKFRRWTSSYSPFPWIKITHSDF
jgi:SAM-dependent methyltransferase